MDEIEVPTDALQEDIQGMAERSQERWVSYVALSSALLAVFAAITALIAGHHANEAMIEQIRSSDKWTYYQTKGIKAAVLASKTELLQASGKSVSEKDQAKILQYQKDQEEISKEARETEAGASSHLEHHVIFARGVTMFQIAIAISAIAALLRQKRFWLISLGFGVVGILFLVQGLFFFT